MEQTKVSLRPFKLSDADDFLKWANDERITRYLRWATITTREEALKYLEDVAIPHPWRQSICTADDDRTIGYVSVKPETGNDRHRAHISYAVGVQYWGQGIATMAIKMAIGAVFKQFPYLVRIEALVELDNGGSARVLEKVGFKREGLLRKYGFNKGQIRDMFMFSFLSIDEIIV